MVSGFFKILLSLVTCSGCIFCSSAFGLNLGLIWVMAATLLILVSAFVKLLYFIGRVLGIGLCILSLVSFALLMLAGFIGGAFHLSPSNVTLAYYLFFIMIVGISAFFWPTVSGDEKPTQQENQ